MITEVLGKIFSTVIKDTKKIIFAPLATIFFISQPWIGGIFWIALLINPRLAAFSLLGLAIALFIEKHFELNQETKIGGDLKANALFTALMTAWLMEPLQSSLISELIIISASSAVAAIIAISITRALKTTNLPPMLLGYCITAIMLFSICPPCSEQASQQMPAMLMPENTMDWAQVFFQSLGYLIYSPTLISGIIVGLAILLWSRLLFLTGLIGWVSGITFAQALETTGMIYHWLPTSYNYFIAGMALGSVYFLPGRSALLLSVLGGSCAALLGFLLQQILTSSAIAYLPISAITTIWIFIAAIALSKENSLIRLNNNRHLPPEESWWQTTCWIQRLGDKETLFTLPLAGELRISQGFDGTLSHKGSWRYAVDFQRPTTVNYSPDPALNIWDASIYAPASGVVEHVQNSVKDNDIGISNYADNWGNYITLRLDQGGWALLAHLQQNSIPLTKGMRVEIGDYLGKVGNSGRSPLPHLHLQAQKTNRAGDPTSPFRLANYLSGKPDEAPFHYWNASKSPVEEEVMMAALANENTHKLLASITSGSAVWSIETFGNIPKEFQERNDRDSVSIDTSLNDAGLHLFKSAHETGTLITSLAPDAWRIIEAKNLKSPFLKLLALSTPTIPYAAVTGMKWQDSIPLMPTGLTYWFSAALQPYLDVKIPLSFCKCITDPNIARNTLSIETNLTFDPVNHPTKITTEFGQLSGATKVKAEFQNGYVIYSLLSFEPRLSMNHNED